MDITRALKNEITLLILGTFIVISLVKGFFCV